MFQIGILIDDNQKTIFLITEKDDSLKYSLYLSIINCSTMSNLPKFL